MSDKKKWKVELYVYVDNAEEAVDISDELSEFMKVLIKEKPQIISTIICPMQVTLHDFKE